MVNRHNLKVEELEKQRQQEVSALTQHLNETQDKLDKQVAQCVDLNTQWEVSKQKISSLEHEVSTLSTQVTIEQEKLSEIT